MFLSPLPDDARVWLFAAADPLSADDADALAADVRAGLAGWASHGRPVTPSVEVLEGRVLAVGATLAGDISGCGIDAMEHAVAAVAEARDVTWMSGLDVAFWEDGALRVVPRAEFRRLAREGAVASDTPVLDLTAATVGEVRERGVRRPAGEAWHGRAFLSGSPSGSGLAPAAAPVA